MLLDTAINLEKHCREGCGPLWMTHWFPGPAMTLSWWQHLWIISYKFLAKIAHSPIPCIQSPRRLNIRVLSSFLSSAFPNCYRFLDWQIESMQPAGSWPYSTRGPVEVSHALLAFPQSSCCSYYSSITSMIDSFMSKGSYVFVLIKFLLQMANWTPSSPLFHVTKYIGYVLLLWLNTRQGQLEG